MTVMLQNCHNYSFFVTSKIMAIQARKKKGAEAAKAVISILSQK